MPITFIAAASGGSDATGTSLNTSSALNVAAGDILVAFGGWEATSGSASISDGGSNSFTMSGTTASGSNFLAHGYLLVASANASATFTLTTPNGNYRAIVVLQFRPDSGETVSFDTANTATGNSGTTTSGAITTTGTDEIIVVGTKNYAGSVFEGHTIGGVTRDGVTSIRLVSVWYRIFTATQTGITGSCGCSSGVWCANILSIKSEAGASAASLIIPRSPMAAHIGR